MANSSFGNTDQNPSTSATPWYLRNWFVITSLIVFFPVGLILMWRCSWGRKAKIGTTFAVAILVIARAGSSGQTHTKAKESAVSTTSISQTTTTLPPTTTSAPTTTTTLPPPTTTALPTTTTTVVTVSLCGAPQNPWGYNLCGRGQLIYNPNPSVCDYFDCISSFWNGSGYMTQCYDGTYSMSGGHSGACSYHGGESTPVDT